MTSQDALIGKKVGNYKIIKCLGQGGMGSVYLGEHPEIQSRVAIKVLLPQYVRSDTVVKRFLDEARAVNRIGHPGIVRITDCGEQDDVGVFLVMEYLEGETLQAAGERQGKFSLEDAVGILRQLASALQASHDSGIVHRDLKPANIFLVEDPTLPEGVRVKILDFGIAKLLESGDEVTDVSRTGMVIGSPLFMSPEQCLDSKNVDHRTDIFSLGIIAYAMLSGCLPYQADTLGKLIVKHRESSPPPLRSVAPEVSPALDGVVRRALAMEEEARFQSMEELGEALASALSDPDVDVSAPELTADMTHADTPRAKARSVEIAPDASPTIVSPAMADETIVNTGVEAEGDTLTEASGETTAVVPSRGSRVMLMF